MKTNILMDVSNLFYSSFHAHSKESEDILMAMANKNFMDIINKYSRDYKSDEVVLCFDGKNTWRKMYTMDDRYCLTYKKYKGHRRSKLTDAEKLKLERFDVHVREFCAMLKEYTGLYVLQHDKLEADDLIAGFIQSHPGEKHLIISRDRDFLQLLRHTNVSILDPMTKKSLTLSDYDYDPDYFMFQKCIRGDAGDNVMSAYPRVRETKIKAAYEDEFALNNLLQHEYEVEFIHPRTGDLTKRKYKTGDVFAENELLMDLSRQPKAVKEIIRRTLDTAYTERGEYHMVKFLRFCSRMDFQHIIQDISKYNKLLKGPPVASRLTA